MKNSRTPFYALILMAMPMVNFSFAQQLGQKNNTEPLSSSDSWLIQNGNTSASTANAIMLMDSVYLWHYDTTMQAWNAQPSQKVIGFTYDANYNNTYSLEQEWNGTAWENAWQFSSVYDANSNLTVQETHFWDGVQWANSRKYTFTYDANQNVTVYLRQVGDGVSGWENQQQRTYEYDVNSNETLFNWQNWDGTDWDNVVRKIRTYDMNNNLTSEISQSGDTTAWDNNFRNTYTYDGNDNLINDLKEDWNGTDWVNELNISYTYDGSGNEIEKVQKYWDGTAWVNSSKVTRSFDGNNNLTVEVQMTWSASEGEWKNIARNSWTYDMNDNNTELLMESWNNTDNIWEYTARSNWEYDGAGNVTSSIDYEQWNGSSWVYAWNTYHSLFSYDQMNNETESDSYQWNFGIEDWKKVGHTSHQYDADTLLLSEASIPGSPAFPDENGDSLYYYYHTVNVGVDDFETDAHVSIYPNPNNGQFDLTLPVAMDHGNYRVFDHAGRMIGQGNVVPARTRIDLSDLSGGIYFLRVSDGNRTLGVERVVLMK